MIITGALRTRRANPGGDPSTKRPTRPPNSRDGAGRDAAFRTNTTEVLELSYGFGQDSKDLDRNLDRNLDLNLDLNLFHV